jgi:hypothetical protein
LRIGVQFPFFDGQAEAIMKSVIAAALESGLTRLRESRR